MTQTTDNSLPAESAPAAPPLQLPADCTAGRPGDLEPLQFSLRELLVGMGLIAVVCGLAKVAPAVLSGGGILAASALTLVIGPAVYRRDRHRQALLFDLVWGVVLPLAILGWCWAELASAQNVRVFAGPLAVISTGVAWSTLHLAIWLIGGARRLRPLAGYFVGAWVIAALACLLSSLFVVLASLSAPTASMQYVCVPFVTTFVLLRRMNEAGESGAANPDCSDLRFWLWSAVGLILNLASLILAAVWWSDLIIP